MQVGGPIDADAQVNVVVADEGAPRLVEQRGVGLERLVNRHARAVVPRQQARGLLVKRQGHDRRLARVPEQGERLAGQAAGEDPLEGAPQGFEGHAPGGLPIRPVNLDREGGCMTLARRPR